MTASWPRLLPENSPILQVPKLGLVLTLPPLLPHNSQPFWSHAEILSSRCILLQTPQLTVTCHQDLGPVLLSIYCVLSVGSHTAHCTPWLSNTLAGTGAEPILASTWRCHSSLGLPTLRIAQLYSLRDLLPLFPPLFPPLGGPASWSCFIDPGDPPSIFPNTPPGALCLRQAGAN